MGSNFGPLRGFLLLTLVLCLLGMPACVLADADRKSFDIPAQPAAAALNEFAKQADVTLIFSYDLVRGARTRPLQGRFTVDEGLAWLLADTLLGHEQATDGTYYICPLLHCGRAPAAGSRESDTTGRTGNARRGGGNRLPARLQGKPAAAPGT